MARTAEIAASGSRPMAARVSRRCKTWRSPRLIPRPRVGLVAAQASPTDRTPVITGRPSTTKRRRRSSMPAMVTMPPSTQPGSPRPRETTSWPTARLARCGVVAGRRRRSNRRCRPRRCRCRPGGVSLTPTRRCRGRARLARHLCGCDTRNRRTRCPQPVPLPGCVTSCPARAKVMAVKSPHAPAPQTTTLIMSALLLADSRECTQDHKAAARD